MGRVDILPSRNGSGFSLLFHGAARQVTGSMHFVRSAGRWIALDCGLYQGHRREAAEANRTFPVRPADLAAVVLSHAHIDHSGNLPHLVHEGFAGPIYATAATRDLAEIMLRDSGHIHEEDAAYWNLKHPDDPIEPYYTQEDAARATARFLTADYGRPFEVLPGLSCRLTEAGHILGSAVVTLTRSGPDGRGPIVLCYTGDIGRKDLPILRDPDPLPDCDYLITEATYGNRRHERIQDMKGKLAGIVAETVGRGGRVVIPAFSVGRTQAILYYLREIFLENLAPQVDVFVDSPLAVRATEIFARHPEIFDAETRALLGADGNGPFQCPRCHFITDVAESKALNERKEPCVIISASGMCEAGRILHHLKHAAGDQKNAIVVTGFMAANTLGRRIVEHALEIRIFGKMYPLEAQVVTLNGLSSHADSDELLAAISPLSRKVRHLFVVHGEPAQADPFVHRCREAGFAQVSYPERGDRYDLT